MVELPWLDRPACVTGTDLMEDDLGVTIILLDYFAVPVVPPDPEPEPQPGEGDVLMIVLRRRGRR